MFICVWYYYLLVKEKTHEKNVEKGSIKVMPMHAHMWSESLKERERNRNERDRKLKTENAKCQR